MTKCSLDNSTLFQDLTLTDLRLAKSIPLENNNKPPTAVEKLKNKSSSWKGLFIKAGAVGTTLLAAGFAFDYYVRNIQNNPREPSNSWQERFTLATDQLDLDKMKGMLDERYGTFCSNMAYFKDSYNSMRCPAKQSPHFEVFEALAKSNQPIENLKGILDYISQNLDQKICNTFCFEQSTKINLDFYTLGEFQTTDLLCLKDLLTSFNHPKWGCLPEDTQFNLLRKFYPYFSQFSLSKDPSVDKAYSHLHWVSNQYLIWYLMDVLPNLPSYEESNLRNIFIGKNFALNNLATYYMRRDPANPIAKEAEEIIQNFAKLHVNTKKGFLDLVYPEFNREVTIHYLELQGISSINELALSTSLLDQGFDFNQPLFLSKDSKPISLLNSFS